jgi:signal peptide peptidase SppA
MQTLSGLDDLKGLMVKEGYAPQETSLTRVRGGVAVIDVFGPILRIDSFIAWILGLSSVDAIAADVLKAMENNQVSSVILNIDSPGGQIAGVNELANHIAEAGKVKPVYAYASHQMASAAYWLGASAKEIVADATAAVGSIGVVAGLRRSFGGRIEIVNSASPKKRLDPESDEGRREVLKRVDAVAEIFISAVMAGRNLSREAVVGLEGGILTGQQAVEHGLADRIGGLEQLISELNHAKPYSGGMAMDKSQLQTEHADLYQEVLNEGKEQGRQEAEQGLGEAKEAAGKEARESVLALAKSAFGEELGAKLTQLVESGVTADQVKALSESGLFAGQGQGGQEPVDPSKQAVIDALEESSQEPPGSLKGGGDDIEATWNKDPKVRAEFGDNFEAFKAYTENARAGRARILSRPEQ